jgi:hypothetical protein
LRELAITALSFTRQILSLFAEATSSTHSQPFVYLGWQGVSSKYGASKQASTLGEQGRQAPKKIREASKRS